MKYSLINLSNISIEKLERHLQKQGWKKLKKKENLASLWSLGDRQILLPLNPEFVDFESRLADVVICLSKVEKRSTEEIISLLTETSSLAEILQREVLELRIESLDGNRTEISAGKLGGVLQALQTFVKSFDEAKKSDKLEVSVVGTFPGSFGIHLAIANEERNKQLELFEHEKIEEVILKELLLLIQHGNQDDKSKFLNRVGTFSQKAVKTLKGLTGKLVSLESNVYFEWGSQNRKATQRSNITYEHLNILLEKLNDFDDSEVETIEVVGKLAMAGTGKDKRTRRFIIISPSVDKPYEGYISESLLEKNNYKMVVGEVYRGILEKKSKVNSTTGEEKESFTLIDLSDV